LLKNNVSPEVGATDGRDFVMDGHSASDALSWYNPVRGGKATMNMRTVLLQLACAAAFAWSGLSARAEAPRFGPVDMEFCGRPAPPCSDAVCGFSIVADSTGPQVAVMERPPAMLVVVREKEAVVISIPVAGVRGSLRVTARAEQAQAGRAVVSLAAGESVCRKTLGDDACTLEIAGDAGKEDVVIRLTTTAAGGEAAVRWSGIQLTAGGRSWPVPVACRPSDRGADPPSSMLSPRPAIEQAMIEWDWRMQDGIATPRVLSSYADAVARTLQRGNALLGDLQADGVAIPHLVKRWKQLQARFASLRGDQDTDERSWENLWREVHQLRRQIVLANPRARIGPLLFVKQVPSAFSHQLTQYYGRDARPGGGLFVLEKPGMSFACRQLAADLPLGSYQHPEVSYDGRRILFAYCRVEKTPPNRDAHGDVHYHLYEVAADGRGLRQLTDGPFDDFSPRWLPNGRILFLSTRRGGFHRCGRGPCPTYTLALAEADGSNPRPISFHETHEWDPAVLNDGRVIYTRWDYVDRHAVHYQQLWTTRPDGTDVRIFYGNNTLHPIGVWEARAVPGSRQVMATAAAHHAMTAGSIVLLDVTRGRDGLKPITRLTPDALFPESEAPVVRATGGQWHAPVGVQGAVKPSPEAVRWPGHCYRSPWPLSEKYFLAAYSFDSLIGEPTANPANMFGIYLVDRFGNKELLYRDLNIASLWPVPLRARTKPPILSPVRETTDQKTGTFYLQNVYAAWPPLPKNSVKRLRIVQVLPKSTPHLNNPRVGLANASPGKQVLGTVPVEADGSAYFTAPAGVPLAFQALDEMGQAIQVMRSVVYLQPGETASCVGCHEPRWAAPMRTPTPRASARPPSAITPAPEGSRPFSYVRLVQPVLDKHCVRCHNRKKPEGKVMLTGEAEGRFTVSYNALAPRVSYSDWNGKSGDFRQVNSEPMTKPGFFGAKGSPLMTLLLKRHGDVTLSKEEIERLATWMDANALFYGTFNPADQARQQRGEQIAGPALQ